MLVASDLDGAGEVFRLLATEGGRPVAALHEHVGMGVVWHWDLWERQPGSGPGRGAAQR